MASVQVNIRTTPVLARELDRMVTDGYFRNRTEAINEGIRLLVRRYQLKQTKTRIDRIRERASPGAKGRDLVREMHENEGS